MRLSKLLIFSFIFLISISFVSAAKINSQQFVEGYVIRIPQDNTLKVGQDYAFEFHIHNISDGTPITTNLNCSFHLYDYTGEHIYEGWQAEVSHHFDYGFDVNGGNFTTPGEYWYNILCFSPVGQKEGARFGGYNSEIIYVTPTGINFKSVLNNPMILILGLLALCLILFGAIKGIPWFGFIGAVLFLMIGIYTMIYGFDTVTDLYTRSVALVFIGIGFIFMFAAAYEWLYADGDN